MDIVKKYVINARQKVWHQERFYQEIWHQVYAFCEDGVVKTLWRTAFAIQSLKEGNLKKDFINTFERGRVPGSSRERVSRMLPYLIRTKFWKHDLLNLPELTPLQDLVLKQTKSVY